MHHEHPELIRDQYWDQVFPTELPYTVAAGERERHPEPSTANIAVSDADAEYSMPPKCCDDGQAIVNFIIIMNIIFFIKLKSRKLICIILKSLTCT